MLMMTSLRKHREGHHSSLGSYVVNSDTKRWKVNLVIADSLFNLPTGASSIQAEDRTGQYL